jgi:hypothetical protein
MADKWGEIERIAAHVAEIHQAIAFCEAQAAQLEEITNPWDHEAMADKWEGFKWIDDHVAEIQEDVTFCKTTARKLADTALRGAKALQLEETAFCRAKAAQFPSANPWDRDIVCKEGAFYATLAEKWEGMEWLAAQAAELHEELAFCEAKTCQLEEIAFCQLEDIEFHLTAIEFHLTDRFCQSEKIEFHLTDPHVLDPWEQPNLVSSVLDSGETFDSGEKSDVADTEDFSVLDSGEKCNVADTMETKFRKGPAHQSILVEDSSVLEDSGVKVGATVTAKMEPETSHATLHLMDHPVLDSGEQFDVAGDAGPSFLDPGEQFNVADDKKQFNVADDKKTKFRSPLKPHNFQDDKHCPITVNVIWSLPFVTEEPTVADVFDQNLIRTSSDNRCVTSCPIRVIGILPFATEEPTVADVFDQNLIRTSFANLCMASCQTHTFLAERIPSNSTRSYETQLCVHCQPHLHSRLKGSCEAQSLVLVNHEFAVCP